MEERFPSSATDVTRRDETKKNFINLMDDPRKIALDSCHGNS